MSDPERDAAPGGTHRGRTGDTTSEADNLTTDDTSDPLSFARILSAQDVPIVVAPPIAGSGEFQRPTGWQNATADGNAARLELWRPGWAVMAVTGPALTVFDVDPRNGGDVEHVREWLKANGVRVFAEVRSPGGGAHFYAAGDARLHTVPIDGLPGVDFQAAGHNVFLPGTERPKYNGAGYTVIDDTHLEELAEGDTDGVDAMLAVTGHRPDRQPVADVADNAIAALYTDGEPDDVVAGALEDAVFQIGTPGHGSRHQNLGTHAGRILRHGADGRPGVAQVLNDLESVFVGAIGDRATPDQARREYRDRVASMARQVAATPSGPTLHEMAGLPEPTLVIDRNTFWSYRADLAYIRRVADARMVSPWAVLGALMARVIADVGPTVQIPALVGSVASLNLFVALLGPSGTGKTAAVDVALELWPNGEDVIQPVGSGEGLAAGFVTPQPHPKKGDDTPRSPDGMIWKRRRCMVLIDEIGEYAALVKRNGSTLASKLRSAFSGAELGNNNADETKNRRTGKHTYRLTLIVGVQPSAAGHLLDDHGTGTPQRFAWMPATVDTTDDVDEDMTVEPLDVVIPAILRREQGDVALFAMPDVVRDEVRANKRRLSRGEGGAYDGHAMLCRVKVAVALAVLDGRVEVTVHDWNLSATVMAVSDTTRDGALAHAMRQREQQAVSAGRLQAITADTAEVTLDARRAEVYRRKVRAWLEAEPMPRRALLKKANGQRRRALAEVVDDLIERGVVADRDGFLTWVQG